MDLSLDTTFIPHTFVSLYLAFSRPQTVSLASSGVQKDTRLTPLLAFLVHCFITMSPLQGGNFSIRGHGSE